MFGAALLWISTGSAVTSYSGIALQMVVLGTGMGLTSAPATEAIMGGGLEGEGGHRFRRQRCHPAVRRDTRGGGDRERCRVALRQPAGVDAADRPTFPAQVAAKGSVGGAAVASERLSQAGLGHLAQHLQTAATQAFLHSFAGGCQVAGGVALGGAVFAAILLPARPTALTPSAVPDTDPGSRAPSLEPGIAK